MTVPSSDGVRVIRLDGEVDIEGFRSAARLALRDGVSPDRVRFVTGEDEGDLFAAAFAPLSSAPAADLRVPAKFIPLVEQVERHRDPARFDLLYTVLWRLRHTPGLLDVASDPLVRRLENMARSVRRDRHKMTAFWPAAGLVDTEKRCFMKPEVGYGEASIQSGVQGRDGSSGSRRGVSVARPGRLVDEG